MSQVHFEIWSFDDRHDGFLSWIETRTNAFVDVIYSTGKNLQTHVCNESKWVPLSKHLSEVYTYLPIHREWHEAVSYAV